MNTSRGTINSPPCVMAKSFRGSFPWGDTHILRQIGMCRSNESLFDKKSQNMGAISTKVSQHMAPFFQNFQNFWKNWPTFQEKPLKNEYLFLPKWPFKMGVGFEAQAAHPCPNQIGRPPWSFLFLTSLVHTSF